MRLSSKGLISGSQWYFSPCFIWSNCFPCQLYQEPVSLSMSRSHSLLKPGPKLNQSNPIFFSILEQQSAERTLSWRWSGAYVVRVSLCCLWCCSLTTLNSVSDVVTNHCPESAVSNTAALSWKMTVDIISNCFSPLFEHRSQCKTKIALTWNHKLTKNWMWTSVAD